MTGYAPRRSCEVHAERVDVTHVPAGTFDTLPVAKPSGVGRAAIWRVLARRAALDEPHTMGAAECVCEEPCRYCQCEKP